MTPLALLLWADEDSLGGGRSGLGDKAAQHSP